MEEGDLDEDYRLRFGEFSRLMAADYVPSNKREFRHEGSLAPILIPSSKWNSAGTRDQETKTFFLTLILFDMSVIPITFSVCSMDNRRYEDGTKTKVDCNGW